MSMKYYVCILALATRRANRVCCHLWPVWLYQFVVICDLSGSTSLLSSVTCLALPVCCRLWPVWVSQFVVICDLSGSTSLLSSVTCLALPVCCHLWPVWLYQFVAICEPSGSTISLARYLINGMILERKIRKKFLSTLNVCFHISTNFVWNISKSG